MIRDAEGERVEPRPGEQADATGRLDPQHKRQRPRPEGAREPLGVGVEPGERARRVDAGDVRDQRIEGRASLRRIDRRDRCVRGRIGRKAVNRLGRHGDEAALPQARRRGGDRFGRRLDPARRSALSSQMIFLSAVANFVYV